MEKAMPAGRQGFTLIELTITLGIFAIIMLVGSNFLIQTIQNANTAAIQNEVRQNANLVLRDIVGQVRTAYCIYYVNPQNPPYTNTALLRTSDDPNNTTCASGNRVEYFQDHNGVVTRAATDSGNTPLSFGVLTSVNTAVLNCITAGKACGSTSSDSCAVGLIVTSPGGGMPIVNGAPATVAVLAQQLPGSLRADVCASVKLTDTITPRVK